jgi:hypothetical protein
LRAGARLRHAFVSASRLPSNQRPAPKDKTRRQRKPVDPRRTLQQALGSPQWSEDRRDTPRACVRAPGPCRRHPHRVDVPKDASAKEVNTSRPCGPVAKHSDRQRDPKVSPTSRPLALRSKELITTDPLPCFAAPKSNSSALKLSSELLREWSYAALHDPQAPKSHQAAHDDASRSHGQLFDRLVPATRPRRDKKRALDGRMAAREDAVPNMRAASELRRVHQQGAARSGRLQVSLSASTWPSARTRRSKQGLMCRLETHGCVSIPAVIPRCDSEEPQPEIPARTSSHPMRVFT